MALAPFVYKKKILIDDAGWGDLILGVVIGALKLPERRYMERRIPTSAFQSPNFENKQYLDEAVKIAEEFVEVMQPDKETYFEVCSGYVLSHIRNYLRNKGFHIEKAKITGELQERIEKKLHRMIHRSRNPTREARHRKQKPFLCHSRMGRRKIEIRENLVKTGWKSWHQKWRKEAHKLHLQKIDESTKKVLHPSVSVPPPL